MPIFEVTSPTGEVFEVEAPQGASQEDAIAYIASQQTQQAAPEEQEESGFLRRYVGDPLASIGQGVVGLGEAAVGLADIPTRGYAGKGFSAASKSVFGGDLEDASQYFEDLKTPEQLAQETAVDTAEGFTGTLGALVDNPAALVDLILNTLPQMAGGAGIARAGLSMAKKRAVGKLGPGGVGPLAKPNYLKAAGVGEGVVAAGAAAEGIRKQTEDGLLTPTQAILATGTGVITGVLGVIGGKVANKLGVTDIDALMAGQSLGAEGQRKVRNSLLVAIRAGIGESVFEELPQSMQEQMIQNIALDRDPMEGVSEAAAQGVAAGFTLAGSVGGGGQFLQNTKIRKEERAKLIADRIEESEASDDTPDKPNFNDQKKAEEDKILARRAAEKAQAEKDKGGDVVGRRKKVPATPVAPPVDVDVDVPESGRIVSEDEIINLGFEFSPAVKRRLEKLDYSKPQGVQGALKTLNNVLESRTSRGKDATKLERASIPSIQAKINSLEQVQSRIEQDKLIDEETKKAVAEENKNQKIIAAAKKATTKPVEPVVTPVASEPTPAEYEGPKPLFTTETLDSFGYSKTGSVRKKLAGLMGGEAGLDTAIAQLEKTLTTPAKKKSAAGKRMTKALVAMKKRKAKGSYNVGVQTETNLFSEDQLVDMRLPAYTRKTLEGLKSTRPEDVSKAKTILTKALDRSTKNRNTRETIENQINRLERDELKGITLPDNTREALADPSTSARTFATPAALEEGIGKGLLVEKNGREIYISSNEYAAATAKNDKNFETVSERSLKPVDEKAISLNNPLTGNSKNPITGKKPVKVGDRITIARINNAPSASKNPETGKRSRSAAYKPEKFSGVVEEQSLTDSDTGQETSQLVLKLDKPINGVGVIGLNDSQVVNPVAADFKRVQNVAQKLKAKYKGVGRDKNKNYDAETSAITSDIISAESSEASQELNRKEKITLARRKLNDAVIKQFGTELPKTVGELLTGFAGTMINSKLNIAQRQLLKILVATPNINNVALVFDASGTIAGDASGQYDVGTNTITLESLSGGFVETVFHEMVHAATARGIRNLNPKNKPFKQLTVLFTEANLAASDAGIEAYANIESLDEFVTLAFSDKNYQQFLSEVKTKTKMSKKQQNLLDTDTLWRAFVDAVKAIVVKAKEGISRTVLNNVITLQSELFLGPDAAKQRRYEGQILYDTGNNVTETTNEKELSEKAGLLDKITTKFFSFDAGLNRALVRAMNAAGVDPETIENAMYKMTAAQGLHATNMAQQYAIHGIIEYNEDAKKFVVKDEGLATSSMAKIKELVSQFAINEGISPEEAGKIAHKSFEATRLDEVQKGFNADIIEEAQDLEGESLKSKLNELKMIHLNEQEITEGLLLKEQHPELVEIAETWNKVRIKTIEFAVDRGTMSTAQAEEYIDSAGYVPFYRNDDDGNPIAGVDITSGLTQIGNLNNKTFRGSEREVTNIFENMDRWVQHQIRAGIINQLRVDKVDTTMINQGEDKPLVRGIDSKEEAKTKGNVVSVTRNKPRTPTEGDPSTTEFVTELYEFSDPIYAAAFGPLQAMAVDGWKQYFRTAANFLRQNIVLYPLFSISQLPQDSMSAMISSGVKNPFMIPLRVLKEFSLTLVSMSETHKELEKFGAVGGRAWTQAVETDKAAAEKAIAERDTSKLTNKLYTEFTESKFVKVLEKIAMSSDNAVRQAVYEQTMKETGNQALAVERAFEVINFRRKGSSQTINTLSQVVPFFSAGLQALSVQARVLSGGGIAPGQRAEQMRQTITSGVMLTGVYLAYAAAMSGDEDYEKLDPREKDTKLILPGGWSIPLRPDLFTYMVKVVPENILREMRGDQDGEKTFQAIKRGFINSVSMSAIPQAIRPMIDLYSNESGSFSERRKIVPDALQDEEGADQFKENTSELAIMLAEGSGVSAIKIDYFLRQYFGYTAGLITMAVDEVIVQSGTLDYERPNRSFREVLLDVPGTTPFIVRQFGNREISDYYEMREDVAKVVSTFNKMQGSKYRMSYDRKRVAEFYEENKKMIEYGPLIRSKNKMLSDLRAYRQEIIAMPRELMGGADKKRIIDETRRKERLYLRDIKKYRERLYD